MTVLVTGGTGFIGSHLVERLVSVGENVRCLVRKTSNTKFLESLGVELTYGDITDKNSLIPAVEGVEVVYHLAGISEVSQKIPYQIYEKYNVTGTLNVATLCLKEDIKKFLNFSSVEAYSALGELNTVLPIKETFPCNPTTYYGISKREAEQRLLDLYKENGLPVTIIRPSVVYGPRDIQHGPFKLFRGISRGFFRIIGNGENLVSWTYIGNLVHLSELAKNSKKSIGEIYFAADEKPYTMNKICKIIAEEEEVSLSNLHIPLNISKFISIPLETIFKILNQEPLLSKSKIRFIASNYIYDVSKAKKDLGYTDQFSLREGVRLTVKWYKENKFL
jgi:nucleoside-diphosphate-sugar epimerase